MKLQPYKLLILLLTFVSVYNAYSATPPKYGGVVRLAISQKNLSLDPINIITSTEYYISGSIFDGLVKFDKNKSLFPAIASSWEISEDRSIITFHIADLAKFHNGRKITAEDIKYSWLRSIRNADSELIAECALKLVSGYDTYRQRKTNNVSGLQIIDEKTIQVSLNQLDDTFLYKLDHPLMWIIPKESAIKDDFSQRPVGSGPFKIVPPSNIDDEILRLSANEEYVWGRPYLNELVFISTDDFESLLLNYETGEIDCLEIPNIEFGRFKNHSSWLSQLYTLQNCQLTCIKINRKSFTGKVRIPSFLKNCIDINSILGMLYNQGKSLSEVNYQLNRAIKEAMEFQNAQIKLIVLNSDDPKKIADRIAFDLARAEIIINITPLSCQNFHNALNGNLFSLALLSLPSFFNVDSLNKSIYVPLFYQNINFLRKPYIHGLSESYYNGRIHFDSVYILKPSEMK